MTDHSPDHAERAKEVLARSYEKADAPPGSGQRFCAANVRVIGKRDYADWKDHAALTAMLAYADERVADALRGRDRVVEALTTALHDAISRPAGVVPASAEPFYDWRRYDRGPARDAKAMREEQPAAADNPATGDSR